MSKYNKHRKTLSELRKIGSTLPRIFSKENPCEVDIELLLDKHYGIKIDLVPLKIENGIEAYASICGKKIYMDIGLADSDWQEKRYRFTLAEELAHIILHQEIYSDVESFADWEKVWNDIPEDIHEMLDKNAKELAGIILMPEREFIKRLLELREEFYEIYRVKGKPSNEQQSHIIADIRRRLIDDFNINEEPCRIRIIRIEMWKGKSIFEF